MCHNILESVIQGADIAYASYCWQCCVRLIASWEVLVYRYPGRELVAVGQQPVKLTRLDYCLTHRGTVAEAGVWEPAR